MDFIKLYGTLKQMEREIGNGCRVIIFTYDSGLTLKAWWPDDFILERRIDALSLEQLFDADELIIYDFINTCKGAKHEYLG